VLAQIFSARFAEATLTAGVMQPGDADPLAYFDLLDARADLLDDPDDLMTSNSPSTTCRSVRQTPQAVTRTSNSSSPGDGAATSRNSSGF
jgi:hypothetical protein